MFFSFVILSVRLYASYVDQKVFVEQIGPRSSGLNGFKTEQGVKLIAQHGDCLEILYNKYPYKIEFNPPLKVKTENNKPKTKRLLSQDSEEENESQASKKTKLKSHTDNSFAMATTEVQQSNEKSIDNGSETVSGVGTSSTSSINKLGESAGNGTWEHFSNKTLYVYTSNGCTGRSKVRKNFSTFSFIFNNKFNVSFFHDKDCSL